MIRLFLILFLAFSSNGWTEEYPEFERMFSELNEFNRSQRAGWLSRLENSCQGRESPFSVELDHCFLCLSELGGSERVSFLDKDNIELCTTWFSKQGGAVDGKTAFIAHFSRKQGSIQPDFLYSTPLPKSCRRISVFGIFHAYSTDYGYPLVLAKAIAQRFQSKEVCYDGISCNIFNNTEDVQACARRLESEKCLYSISGNQNVGVSNYEGWFFRKRLDEVSSSKSRATVITGGGRKTSMTYDSCSPKGSWCAARGYVIRKNEKNDPLTKTCMLGAQKVSQTCCSDNRWSEPGGSCLN